MILNYRNSMKWSCSDYRQNLGMKLKKHPCFWSLMERFYYFEEVRMRLFWGDYNYSNDGDLAIPCDRSIIVSVLRSLKFQGWAKCIPDSTPLKRIYEDGRFKDDAYDLLRFLRVVKSHLCEKKSNEAALKYINVDESEDYCSIEFVETMVSECFPGFLVETMEGDEAEQFFQPTRRTMLRIFL
ncbi:unnamed protein product [Dovyalis caffra]|uniref:Uncharacterized protein n=1 Tax=Dovyalis caffra TaxID=77055 RepID=A0AAV1QPT2_9ROSI|nr:unnamed protein product [Dovyalis caffra]